MLIVFRSLLLLYENKLQLYLAVTCFNNAFVFLLGYPGRTVRQKTASFLKYEQDVRLPAIVELYSWQIGEMDKAAALDRSVAINTPGQSGQPGSDHYADLMPLWDEGRYFPVAFTRQAVEKGAVARLMLDNFPHIKAYWIMIGAKTAQLGLNFGADDLDGTGEAEVVAVVGTLVHFASRIRLDEDEVSPGGGGARDRDGR